ncbi:hypothetical protein FRC03_003257 [Tulasnella sp. 419]|nr:hypothetical protein FRC03_003257 [Tulasnella sp. 419]
MSSEATDVPDMAIELQAALHSLFAAQNRMQTFEQWATFVISLSDLQGLLDQGICTSTTQPSEGEYKGMHHLPLLRASSLMPRNLPHSYMTVEMPNDKGQPQELDRPRHEAA